MEVITTIIQYVPLVVLGLLPIMNPLATVPLFMMLTKNMPPEQKLQQARMACFYAFAILCTFLFVGNWIISIFGISMAGIRVAGGLIILVLSFRMLFGESEASNVDASPAEIKQANLDFSFSPLAMPSMSGPGSIAVVMGYGSEIPSDAMAVGYAIVVIAILITTLVAYLALRSSSWLSNFLGQHGIQAVTKIMGFLLTCIAVQFIASGVRDFIVTFRG